ncbi:MAG TPA: hypothetical protein VFK49_01640 [Stellaceae bacterium]|nr:hypothetical protein [Stellaceae bacterium]
MEDASERDVAGPATTLEDNTDAMLSLLFGATLQAATVRMVIYLVIACAIVATVASLA